MSYFLFSLTISLALAKVDAKLVNSLGIINEALEEWIQENDIKDFVNFM